MVVARKHDGSPRRTVDLSPLNHSTNSKRETQLQRSFSLHYVKLILPGSVSQTRTLTHCQNFTKRSKTSPLLHQVNQVADYGQLREHMEPFHPFLSPRHPFKYTPGLDKAFRLSKKAIVEAIKEILEIFDLDKRTCLRRLVEDRNWTFPPPDTLQL